MAELDAIRARAAAATPGPWDFRRALGCKEIGRRVNRQTIVAVAYTPGLSDEGEDRANAEFIAHARQDVEDLLALVDRLRQVVDEVEDGREAGLTFESLAMLDELFEDGALTPGPGRCRVCGCTDLRACDPPCSWADADHTLCTACRDGRDDG